MTMQATLAPGSSAGEKRGCSILNKNATGLGAPVAVKLSRKDWLNCRAETRPENYGEQLPMLI